MNDPKGCIDPDRDFAAFQRGMAIRKTVLGDDYVANAMEQSGAFMAPLQKVITEWAWGANWAEEVLSLRDRSLITLALMTALNRPAEFGIHVRGALNNGVTPEELQSLLLHCAAYCGIPAAIDSFVMAREILAETTKDRA